MIANERYEKAWDSFLVYLNRNPKATLSPFLKERHVNPRTMMNWMSEKDIQFCVPNRKSDKPRRLPVEKRQKHQHQVQV